METTVPPILLNTAFPVPIHRNMGRVFYQQNSGDELINLTCSHPLPLRQSR